MILNKSITRLSSLSTIIKHKTKTFARAHPNLMNNQRVKHPIAYGAAYGKTTLDNGIVLQLACAHIPVFKTLKRHKLCRRLHTRPVRVSNYITQF